MIEDIRQSTSHGIRPICDALGVPRSSYYQAAQATPTQQSDQKIGDLIDLCSRKIIGWSLADNLRTELAVNALQQAIESRCTAHQPIFHSDRGRPIRLRRIPGGPAQDRDASEHVCSGEPLPLCLDGILYGKIESRNARRRLFHRRSRRSDRNLLLHRILPQRASQTLLCKPMSICLRFSRFPRGSAD